MSFNQIFQALLKEAQLTHEILGAGATQIRKANYSKKAYIFNFLRAFTSLSTGLERIGKLCLILDSYIKNGGEFQELDLRKNVGHNLLKLYTKSLEIVDKRSIQFEFLNELETEIHQNILKVLSSFSSDDRYSNINYLVKEKKSNDPIISWYDKVDSLLYEKCLSDKKKKETLNNAGMIEKIMGEDSKVLYLSERGEERNKIYDASKLTGYKVIAPYRQLYIL